MGRHAGWLTLYAGIAGGADAILIPEFPMPLQDVIEALDRCKQRDKQYAIIAVAEGAKVLDENGKEITVASEEAVDSFGHVQLGGIGDLVKEWIKQKTGRDVRSTVLGHTQRGGTPTAFDRVISTAYGVRAMQLVQQKDFGKMPAIVRGQITFVLLAEAVAKLKTVSEAQYSLAKVFFG